MKIAKLLGTCLTLCLATTILAPKSNAANPPAPQIVLVGSSGAWYSMAVSSVEPDPITLAASPCTGATATTSTPTNFWTQKNGTASPVLIGGLDSRALTPHEGGNVWISWNNDATLVPYGPNPIVCAYLSVDSVVGQRMLFGTHGGATGSLILDASEPAVGVQPTCNPGPVSCGVPCPTGVALGKVGAKAVPQFNDSANTLPCTVWNILNSTPTFNGAATDIRPEDALFANSRALVPCTGACGTDVSKTGLGYGPYPTGIAVQSAIDATSANVLAYNLTGNDPISTADTVTPGAVIQIGAYPIIIFANVTATTNPGDFGNAAGMPTNILSHVFGEVFSSTSLGGASRTSDVTGSLTVAGQPMNILSREPVSGTWNTVEWQLVRNQGFFHSQEEGVDPANSTAPACTPRPVVANCGDPFFMSYPDGATRRRTIGTGQEVGVAGGKSSTALPTCTGTPPYTGIPGTGIPNSIGYAFWSFATFADACVHADLHYLQLDGVDPLFSSYSANPTPGVLPTCTAIPCTALTMPNVVNGNYRAWNIIRMVMKNTYVAPASGPSVPALVLAAQNQAHVNIPDFVPFVYCAVASCTPATVNTTQPLWVTAPTGVTSGLTAFRSHFTSPCQTVATGVTVCPQMGNSAGNLAIDGTNQTAFFAFPPWSENEADMAGAVLTVTSDVDSLSDFGASQLDLIQ
jgi:hypothetical protein